MHYNGLVSDSVRLFFDRYLTVTGWVLYTRCARLLYFNHCKKPKVDIPNPTCILGSGNPGESDTFSPLFPLSAIVFYG